VSGLYWCGKCGQTVLSSYPCPHKQNGVLPTGKVIDITIVICSWCGKPLAPRLSVGVNSIPPGVHPATVQVSHEICPDCEYKMKHQNIESHSDTGSGFNTGEEKR
jgi:hypothetical protein